MRRLLTLIEEPVPSGSEWHKDLVELIIHPVPDLRPAIIDDRKLARALSQLRGFRHVATHVYNEFDRDPAALAVKAAETFLAGIEPAIARFRAVIDPG
ncbi:MAG TPA: hypothetical protein VH414_16450 [Lichenihabitans sp.]|jgi:hypothetical protein|nr:hypothetical protein [Lichenihabitans sp.]